MDPRDYLTVAVVLFAIGVAGFEATRHPEMHAEPDITRKAKGHLLRRGEGFNQLRARERLAHCLHI